MLERPQQPALSSRTFQPAASSSSIAARPIAGSVKVVNESARKTTSPREPADVRALLPVPAHERLAGEARQRAPAVDAGDALEQRARRLERPGRFESGAAAAPSWLSGRIAPNSRERSGTPCSSW